MRSIIILSLLFSLCCCHEDEKQSIQFKPISENELNFPADTTFAIPHGKIWDERKRIHDSCVGSSYAANAVFMRTRDSFPLASIVDMKTMKVVKPFPLSNDPFIYLSTIFTFNTTLCYQRRPLDVPIDSFMNNKNLFIIDSSNNKINDELMEAARNSILTEVETGSWLTLELSDALGKIL